MRRAVALVVAAVALVALAPAAQPAGDRGTLTVKSSRFGRILFDGRGYVLYGFTADGRNGSNCRGACAAAWPPLIVRSRAAVRTTVPGIRGRFGVIKRPNGKLQLTNNRLPVYTYAHEGPNQVLCDNVDGWFVVRI